MLRSKAMNKSIIIGVAGGSGSGKTTFAKKLAGILGEQVCTIVGQDSYYIDQSEIFDQDGGKVNFDHPDSIDFDLLASHLLSLKNGHSIKVPIYDFATHKRKAETHLITPHPIILVDGILILSNDSVFTQLDESIFMDVPETIRFNRRLKRDVEERGRTPEGVKKQFYNQVKPMHDQFVEPSKSRATKIVTTETFEIELINFADYLRSRLS